MLIAIALLVISIIVSIVSWIIIGHKVSAIMEDLETFKQEYSDSLSEVMDIADELDKKSEHLEDLVVSIIEPDFDVDTSAHVMLAKTVYGEARGCTKTQQAAVVWCILNRVDDPDYPDTISEVVLQKGQFEGYSPKWPVTDEIDQIVTDVMTRWMEEREENYPVEGRVLPKDYLWFKGNGKENIFRNKYSFYSDENIWDFSWPSPYEEN